MKAMTLSAVCLSSMFRMIFLSVLFWAMAMSRHGMAADAEVSPVRAAGGMASEFRNQIFPPAATPLELPLKGPAPEDKSIIRRAEQLFAGNPALALLLIEKGRIVYENYRSPATQSRPLFSWSMSKSIVAYTLGQMICHGQSVDLDRPAASISSDLNGSVHGEATLRQLLMMSSGAPDALHSGDHVAATPDCQQGVNCDGWQMMRAQRLTGLEYLRQFTARGKSPSGEALQSGSWFSYSGLDTLALANVADAMGGFLPAFEKHIWSRIGAEGKGYWLIDRDNRAIAQAGLSATGRDWARLAMYSLRLLSADDPCTKSFMQAATSVQILNRSKRVGAHFPGYGYQTWILNPRGRISYWWVGFGGQRVGIDPVSEKIIVLSSYRESYMADVYRLFEDWQRQ